MLLPRCPFLPSLGRALLVFGVQVRCGFLASKQEPEGPLCARALHGSVFPNHNIVFPRRGRRLSPGDGTGGRWRAYPGAGKQQLGRVGSDGHSTSVMFSTILSQTRTLL